MIKKAIIICIALIGLFCFTNPVDAATIKQIYLDQNTLEGPGYTVQTGKTAVGIIGGTFHEGALFSFHSTGISAPEGWTALEGPVIYNVQVKNPSVTNNPLWISFRMDGYTSTKRISAAFYNGVTKKWQFVPTWRIPSGEYRTALHFPYATVGLFESNTELAVPEQIAPDPALSGIPAAAVMDRNSGNIIWDRSGDAVRPIASITKLMTALVVLDTHPDWNRVMTYSSAYDREGASLYISPGEQLTVRDLWYSMLTSSANNAAIALADSTGLSQAEFVARMNAKANELHLSNTSFVEPTGLDHRNVSTANEILVFAGEAFRHMPTLQATTSKGYAFTTSAGVRHYMRNSNNLVYSPLYITGSKTGYIDECGYNLVMQTRGPEQQEVLAVVLGATSRTIRESSEETLINWAYQAFDW